LPCRAGTMPSLWGCIELLCVHKKCSLPFHWQVRPVAEGQDPSTRGKEAEGRGTA
jgi:hypothetical protein